jgi:hypothetical protein
VSGALSATFGAIGTIAQRVGDYPLLLAKVLEAKRDDQVHKDVAEFAKDSGKGLTGIVGAGLKAPVDITHNVARGFHNLPKMYGDETVRPLEKVTDVQSGLQAAGKVNAFCSLSELYQDANYLELWLRPLGWHDWTCYSANERSRGRRFHGWTDGIRKRSRRSRFQASGRFVLL